MFTEGGMVKSRKVGAAIAALVALAPVVGRAQDKEKRAKDDPFATVPGAALEAVKVGDKASYELTLETEGAEQKAKNKKEQLTATFTVLDVDGGVCKHQRSVVHGTRQLTSPLAVFQEGWAPATLLLTFGAPEPFFRLNGRQRDYEGWDDIKVSDLAVADETTKAGETSFACKKVSFTLMDPKGKEPVEGARKWRVTAWLSKEVKATSVVAVQISGEGGRYKSDKVEPDGTKLTLTWKLKSHEAAKVVEKAAEPSKPADPCWSTLEGSKLTTAKAGDWANYNVAVETDRGRGPVRRTGSMKMKVNTVEGDEVLVDREHDLWLEAKAGKKYRPELPRSVPRAGHTPAQLLLLCAGIAGADEGQDWRESFTATDLQTVVETKKISDGEWKCRKVTFCLKDSEGFGKILGVKEWHVTAWLSEEVTGPALVAAELTGKGAQRNSDEKLEADGTSVKIVYRLDGFGTAAKQLWPK